jgi:hypothetical protein
MHQADVTGYQHLKSMFRVLAGILPDQLHVIRHHSLYICMARRKGDKFQRDMGRSVRGHLPHLHLTATPCEGFDH